MRLATVAENERLNQCGTSAHRLHMIDPSVDQCLLLYAVRRYFDDYSSWRGKSTKLLPKLHHTLYFILSSRR